MIHSKIPRQSMLGQQLHLLKMMSILADALLEMRLLCIYTIEDLLIAGPSCAPLAT